jgi:hypothetical protein
MALEKEAAMTKLFDIVQDLALQVGKMTNGKANYEHDTLQNHIEWMDQNRTAFINASGTIPSGLYEFENRVMGWDDLKYSYG